MAIGCSNRWPCSQATSAITLTTSASQGYCLEVEKQKQMRLNLAVIANPLGDDLDVADPRRLSTVLETVEALIQYIDDYRQAE